MFVTLIRSVPQDTVALFAWERDGICSRMDSVLPSTHPGSMIAPTIASIAIAMLTH
jgi:hypothetical protein